MCAGSPELEIKNFCRILRQTAFGTLIVTSENNAIYISKIFTLYGELQCSSVNQDLLTGLRRIYLRAVSSGGLRFIS